MNTSNSTTPIVGVSRPTTRGIIFTGKAGSGKTVLANAIAAKMVVGTYVIFDNVSAEKPLFDMSQLSKGDGVGYQREAGRKPSISTADKFVIVCTQSLINPMDYPEFAVIQLA